MTGPRDELGRALELAYRVLGTRDLTEHELRVFLTRKNVEHDVIEGAVAELVAAGVLDDVRYARCFTEDRRLLDQWGTERIAGDLARRGVRSDVIGAALAGIGEAEELEAAMEVLARRCPEPPRTEKDRDRAWRLLVRRGYGPELAYTAVRRYERGFEGRAAA